MNELRKRGFFVRHVVLGRYGVAVLSLVANGSALD